MTNTKKAGQSVVLAFSGGTDTSFCVPYLKEQGYRVITVTVDTGGFTAEEIDQIGARAKELGVTKHHLIDGRQMLYDELVSYIIKGNILRGGVYPLCVGPERIVQATKVVEVARQEDAAAVAHGSTGAGNDQVRFDVAIRTLAPELAIVAPVRELGISRQKEIEYLQGHGFPVPEISKGYSVNRSMLGTTIGGREAIDSWEVPPDQVYPSVIPTSQAPDEPRTVIIGFEQGLPRSLNSRVLDGISILRELNALGANHGVGKDIHLGNTVIGIKGRIAFEAPGPLIIIRAHKELEKLVLTKWQLFWKDHLASAYGDFLHEGLYFDPVMRDIEALINSSQVSVTGEAKVKLHKGSLIVTGVRSPHSLMNKKVATYGEENLLWDGKDAAGFCKLYGLQGVIAYQSKSGK